jgi:hypothetical protein
MGRDSAVIIQVRFILPDPSLKSPGIVSFEGSNHVVYLIRLSRPEPEELIDQTMLRVSQPPDRLADVVIAWLRIQW